MARDTFTPGQDDFGLSGIASKGTWSGLSAYNQGDVVLWLGSSFLAKNFIPSGGSNPGVDTANWQVLAQGGGEVAYAEYTGVDITLVHNVAADISGVTLTVPAGSPAVSLQAYGSAMFTATAANAWGQASLLIYDLDAGATFKQMQVQMEMPVSGNIARGPIFVKQRIPATATARNFKLQQFAMLSGCTGILKGSGTTASVPSVSLEAIAR